MPDTVGHKAKPRQDEDIVITVAPIQEGKLMKPICAIDASQLRQIEDMLEREWRQNHHVPISLEQLQQLSDLARSPTLSFFDGRASLEKEEPPMEVSSTSPSTT